MDANWIVSGKARPGRFGVSGKARLGSFGYSREKPDAGDSESLGKSPAREIREVSGDARKVYIYSGNSPTGTSVRM